MAWKSNSFRRSASSGQFAPVTSPKDVAQGQRPAMERVVEQARQLARDRRSSLGRITDPKLRDSASK